MTGSKVERFKRAMKADGYGNFPPIDAANAEGRLIIIDGHHRAARTLQLEVPFYVYVLSEAESRRVTVRAPESQTLS